MNERPCLRCRKYWRDRVRIPSYGGGLCNLCLRELRPDWIEFSIEWTDPWESKRVAVTLWGTA